MSDVVVIAGTADARQIINELTKLNKSVVATVTTGFGSELLSNRNGVSIYEGKLAEDDMVKLIADTGAKCLVDASHPYAKNVSLNAIAASNKAGTPYVRFERKATVVIDKNIVDVKDFEEAADKVLGMDGNILLTIGSNNLDVFISKIPDYKSRLYARVLPNSKVLAKCETIGLSANNIIAVKGPFSEAMNIEMLKHCNASVLVTKDSGDIGGTLEKISAAEKLGITVVLINRPEIYYPHMVEDIQSVIEFVNTICTAGGIA